LSKADGRTGGQAERGSIDTADVMLGFQDVEIPFRPSAQPSARPTCNRCGFEVPRPRARGCKNPCPNCGTVYPLGDCSD
jgi:predicted RNA-binding Zn-ribbon protein involved in translation (DUF1610 family)